jgi:hypothetical protein
MTDADYVARVLTGVTILAVAMLAYELVRWLWSKR